MFFIHDPAACAQRDLTTPLRSALSLVYMVFAGACFAFASLDQTNDDRCTPELRHSRISDNHWPKSINWGRLEVDAVGDCSSSVVGHI